MERKPETISVKKFLINKMYQKDNSISPEIMDKVISHQFENLHKAVVIHNSVEISGFGKFLFNKNKALRRLDDLETFQEFYSQRLENPESEGMAKAHKKRLDYIENRIEILKNKTK